MQRSDNEHQKQVCSLSGTGHIIKLINEMVQKYRQIIMSHLHEHTYEHIQSDITNKRTMKQIVDAE